MQGAEEGEGELNVRVLHILRSLKLLKGQQPMFEAQNGQRARLCRTSPQGKESGSRWSFWETPAKEMVQGPGFEERAQCGYVW